MNNPETVAEAVGIISAVNDAIAEYQQVINNSIEGKITISVQSLRTLGQAAELYVEKLGEMKVK